MEAETHVLRADRLCDVVNVLHDCIGGRLAVAEKRMVAQAAGIGMRKITGVPLRSMISRVVRISTSSGTWLSPMLIVTTSTPALR